MATATAKLLIKAFNRTGSAFGQVRRGFGRIQRSVASLRYALAALGLGYVIRDAFRAAVEFEKQMAFVSTMLRDRDMPLMAGYATRIEALSKQYGLATGDLARGLYDILSAQVPVSEAMKVLEESARGAVGGFSDVNTTTRAMITLFTAYEGELENVREAIDTMAVSVRLGRFTFEQLSEALGRLAPVAAAAGISADELAAAMALVTRGEPDVRRAFTGLARTITTFFKNTEEGAAAAKKLGIEMSSAALRGGKLLETLSKLKDVEPEIVAKIFPRQRALRTIVIAIRRAEELGMNIDEVKDKSGEMSKMLRKAMDTTAKDVDRAVQQMEQMKRVAGDVVKIFVQLAIHSESFKELQAQTGGLAEARQAERASVVEGYRKMLEAARGEAETGDRAALLRRTPQQLVAMSNIIGGMSRQLDNLQDDIDANLALRTPGGRRAAAIARRRAADVKTQIDALRHIRTQYERLIDDVRAGRARGPLLTPGFEPAELPPKPPPPKPFDRIAELETLKVEAKATKQGIELANTLFGLNKELDLLRRQEKERFDRRLWEREWGARKKILERENAERKRLAAERRQDQREAAREAAEEAAGERVVSELGIQKLWARLRFSGEELARELFNIEREIARERAGIMTDAEKKLFEQEWDLRQRLMERELKKEREERRAAPPPLERAGGDVTSRLLRRLPGQQVNWEERTAKHTADVAKHTKRTADEIAELRRRQREWFNRGRSQRKANLLAASS